VTERGIRRGALQAVKATAAMVDRVRRPASGIVVLLYHRVGGRTDQEMDLPLDLFAQQIEILSGRRVVSLDESIGLLTGGSDDLDGGSPPIVVTFDDGTADFMEVVLPLLVRWQIPSTLYVATKYVDEEREFPGSGRPISWKALREAVSTGLVTVGSHTHSHALLDRLPPSRVREELDRSVRLIADRLDVRCDHFAYPKAIAGRGAEEVVRRTFVSAAVGGNRANVPGRTDLHRLARSPIQVSDQMRWFNAKLDGGLAFEESIRRTINRARYAGART